MKRRDRIFAALRTIKDPCSVSAGRPVDIVSMGLIGQLEEEDGVVRIPLILTEPVCWFSKNIVEVVETEVARVDGVERVEAFLDHETIWTPDRMEAAARQALR